MYFSKGIKLADVREVNIEPPHERLYMRCKRGDSLSYFLQDEILVKPAQKDFTVSYVRNIS